MYRMRPAVIACLLGLSVLAGPARADSAADPVRLVPAQADLLLHVPAPRRAVEAFTGFDWRRQWGQLNSVPEPLASPTARRGQQLIAYFEKQLGLPWPELLDRVAGGGMAAATKFGMDPPPALFIIQGTDAEIT